MRAAPSARAALARVLGAGALLVLAACSSVPQWPARATAFGERVDTTVDSPIASYYLERYLTGARGDAALDARIGELHRRHGAARPGRGDLAALARESSVDFAALFLAERLLADECNRVLNREFAALAARAPDQPAQAPRYLLLFVPGWDYVENGHATGADFARPRALAARHGFESVLAPLEPNGVIDRNAGILAAEIARQSRRGRKLIVASASSAGPTVHVALAELLAPRELDAVAGWVNVGGILQGSPIVEHLLEWPQRPFFELGVLWKGWSREAVVSLGTTLGRARFARLRLDPRTPVVDYVGIPLSGQVGAHARSNYGVLAREGPNDGLTLLADALAPGSRVVIALGADHFFQDPRMDRKTVALMQLMVRLADGDPALSCAPRG